MFVVVVVLACLLVAVAFVVLLVGLARSNVFLLLEMETVVPGFEGGDFDVTLSFLVLLLSFLLRAVSVGLVLEGELVELGLSGLVWFLVLEKMLLLGNFVVLVWFLEETRLDLTVLVWFLEETRLDLMVLVWFLEEIRLSDLMVLVWFFEEILLVGLVLVLLDWVVVFFFKGFSCSSFSASNIVLLC